MEKLLTGFLVVITALMVIIATILIGIQITYSFTDGDTTSYCVKEKERVTTGKSGKYMIFTTNNEVYEITDSLLHGRWDSSNIYGYIDAGKCYESKLQGFRMPFFSLQPNILTIKEINAN